MGRNESRSPETKPAKAAGYRTRQWRNVQRSTLLSAQRYSMFVTFMRSALPVAALALAAAVLAYAMQSRDSNHMALAFESMNRVDDDLSMQKPRLSGTDDNGMPFVVTASLAVQDLRSSDLVRLTDVAADISMKDGTLMHLTAPVGNVDTKKRLLDVSGGIHLVSANGYDARTQAASADLKAGTMHGEEHVDATGAFGSLSADRFVLARDTKQLRFMGHVHTVLANADRAAGNAAGPDHAARLRRTE